MVTQVMVANMTTGDTLGANQGEHGEVDQAWGEATRLFLQSTRDERKRALVETLSTSPQPHDFLKKLLAKTRALYEQRLTERSSWQDRIERAFQIIDRHASIGDVLVNNQGPPVTSAWAVCAVADLETYEDLASNLIDITEQFNSTGIRLLHFPTDDSVIEAATHVYESILRFLVSAVLFLQAKKPIRAIKALSGSSGKFKKMFQDLQQRTASLDRVADIARHNCSRQKTQAETILNWLPTHQVSRLKSYHAGQGTCDWLSSAPEYQKWQAAGFKGPLLIEGGPGTGKTFLAYRLFEKAASIIKIFHSCYESPLSIDFSISVLSNLLKTIASSSHSASWYKSVMAKTACLVLKANESAKADICQLQELVRDIFSDDVCPSVTIVVDALSSCRDADFKLMVDCLQSLAKRSNIKVMILTQLRTAMDCEHIIRLDEGRTVSEVLKYSKDRISRAPGLESMKVAILNTISARCPGMILYAKLLLNDLEGAATADDCEEILTRAPNSLWEYFDQLWLDTDHSLSLVHRTYRNAIFLVLIAAREPLHPETVAHYVALDPQTNMIKAGSKFKQPKVVLENLCRPFIAFMEHCVEIAHPSMKQYIQEQSLSDEDPNAYLAEKCLSQLSNERYARPSYATSSLRRHLLDRSVKSTRCISMTDGEAIPYDYAVRHWQDHMFAVLNPSRSLLSHLANFITGIEVVSWSERLADLQENISASFLNVIIDIRAALRGFIERLTSDERKTFPLEDFFVGGHEKLLQNLADDDEENHLVPYLPSLRLGQWYSISGKSYADFNKAYDHKKLVVEGFSRVLGKRSPLTLEARTSWVNEFWFLKFILEGVAELTDVVEDYRYITLDDKEPYLRAVQNLGVGQYFLTDFTDSLQSLQESGAGLLKIEKEKEWVYQANDLFKGWVLERQGALEEAQKKLESILKSWAPVAGENNGLSLMAKTALGSVLRKQNEYGKAIPQLLFAWRERFKLFTINSNTTVDSGLHLAITFREMDKLQESEDVLDQLEKSDIFKTDIGRQNQVTHIRALIEFDRGNFDSPKMELIRAVQQTTGSDRNRNNRAALWIRTTAADALRHEGKDSEALMLFSELVEPSQDSQKSPPSPTLADEPEPAAQMALAEEALRYVQNRNQAAAKELLENNGLQWVRQKDFWIQQGGPPADTAWMKPPNYEGFIKIRPLPKTDLAVRHTQCRSQASPCCNVAERTQHHQQAK